MAEPSANIVDVSILTAQTRAALEQLERLAGELVVLLADDDLDEASRERVAAQLIAVGPAAVGPLIRLLHDEPALGRTLAAGILCEIGEPAVEPLIECFRDDDPEVRAAAAFTFTAMQDAGQRSESALIALLDDFDEHVRQSAAYALGWQQCRKAVPRLIALVTRPLDMPDRERDPEGWAAAYPYDSAAAVDALGQIGDPRAVKPLIFVVDSQGTEGPLYEETVRALGRLGDPRAAQLIAQAYENGYDGQFVEALADMHGLGCLAELLELAESPQPSVRSAVSGDLIALGATVAAETVAHLLVDPDDDVRATAREELAQTVDDATVAELVTGLESDSAEVRAWTTSLLPLACAWSE